MSERLGPGDPLFGAAVLKVSFVLKGLAEEPGFRVVYFNTLKDLGVTNAEVDAYIKKHQEQLLAHLRDHAKGT